MKKSELIIKLADNELSAEEKDGLEKELFKNPELMKEYVTQIQLNEFLSEKFRSKSLDEDTKISSIEKESPEKKCMDAEVDAHINGAFQSTMDLIDGLEEKTISSEYSNELKEFAAIGINERKGKARLGKNLKVYSKENLLSRWYFVAASLAAALIISFMLYKNMSSPLNNDELFAEYYKSYHFVTEQTRSSDKAVDTMVDEATELYKSKKYTEASVLITDALEINEMHVKARFVYGLTLLETSNYTGAAKEFNRILNNHDSYNIESRWYLALCYLKLEKTNDAKIFLEELSQSKNLYQKKAIEVLSELRD